MNQSVIWKKLLLFIALPFLLCFGLLLCSILHSIYVDKVAQVKMALSYHAQFNQSNLLGKVDSVSMSIMTGANFLRMLDPRHPDARKSGENALFVMLDNPEIHRVWLVYEPNAFDGRDAADKEGYPGAPSGRFMRSFTRGETGPVVIGDMDENIVDDPLLSPWYAVVRKTGQPYLSVNDDTAYAYARNGAGKSVSISITLPIFRDGVFVGCVGGNILLDRISQKEETLPIVSVLLSPDDYKVRLAPDMLDVGKSLDEMGFASAQAIKQAFQDSEPLFLSGERFPFTGEKSFIYFMPIRFNGFEATSYLALGLPVSVINHDLLPLVMIVTLILIVLLLVFLALLFYVGRLISRPIQALAQVAGNASLDDACRFRPEASGQASEIGKITQTFLNMAASLQARIKDEHWSQEMLELHLMLEEGICRNETVETLFRHVASRFASCFGARRVTLEQGNTGGDASEVARYTLADGLVQERQAASWASLWRNAADKPLVWRENTEAGQDTVCVLPIRAGDTLWGGLALVFSGPLSEIQARHLEFIATGMVCLLKAKKGAA